MSSIFEVLQNKIILEKDFAIYRKPDQKDLYFFDPLDQKPNSELLISPFDGKQTAILGASQKIDLFEMKLNALEFSLQKCNLSPFSKEEYLFKITKLTELLKSENNLKKVVFSNPKILKRSVEIGTVFENLLNQNPHSFCYLLFFENQLWMGASPELLADYKEEEKTFLTTALAGTLPKSNQPNWTQKEKTEQKLVTDYILNILQKTAHCNYTLEGPYEASSSMMVHLKTEITAQNIDPKTALKLLDTLDPTPAVCGIPLKDSLSYILQNESYKRELYTGYIGIKNQTGFQSYVNLRCAQVFEDALCLYLGGGITSQSDPEREWEELELKSSVFRKALQEI